MTNFDPIIASDNIKQSYIDYITTTFNMSDPCYAAGLKAELEKEGFAAKGPYLDVNGSFLAGRSIRDLVSSGDASSLFMDLESVEEKKREIKIDRPLYWHQEQALIKANAGNNLVVTTGTGSGKTECFLIPIINALLNEEKQGTLHSPGVRAIIIYPMNALANDQIKRMRKLLKNYRQITFGLYNGNTEHDKSNAISQYRKIHKSNDDEFKEPLVNEILSREEMQSNPPHILITNYSMLEYMLLRPKDDKVFSSAKLRFVVLDEAHIYKGTTGMETAMLMRRLRARISSDNNVQYILTSATLGGSDANQSIVEFGKQLCGVEFLPENIIRSKEVNPEMKERNKFPLGLFADIAGKEQSITSVLKKYGITDYSPDGDGEEKIYELLLHSDLFFRFREATTRPKTIGEINSSLGITKQELIDFVAACAMAEKNGTALIKAKYHFFVRALEGAYITLNQPKELYLKRQEHTKADQSVFEIAVCEDCGRIAIVGKADERTHIFRQVSRKSERDPDECEFFLLWDDAALNDISLEDEDAEELSEEENCDYVICPKCGIIETKADSNLEKICDCENVEYVALKKVRRTKESKTAKCPACGYGSFRSFHLGADAATAVLCTELFEQLPEAETVMPSEESPKEIEPLRNNPFAKIKKPKKAEALQKQKQFLCFSDSRSDAAFFANYMEKSYQEFLRRRGICKVVRDMQKNGEMSLSVKAFADRLSRIFEEEHSFDLWSADGKNDPDTLHDISKQNAWIALLNELFNARRATSLCSMGLISFEYTKNDPTDELDLPAYFSTEFGLSYQEGRSLIEQIVLDACYTGAINAGKEMILNDAEREYIFFTPYEKKLIKCKDGTTKSHLVGWAARARANGKSKYYPNTRLTRLCSTTGMSEDDANKFLGGYWDAIISDSPEAILNICDFRIRLNSDPNVHTYRCKKCGRITVHNVRNKCSVVRCDGQLEEIDPEEFYKNNHYMNLYDSDKMKPLQMKEHTAQLSRNRQSRYQEAFVNGEINALSCSTTFEMGVDVGGLETVCMRDIPPSPSNYVQRAGRAGRASHTAAFVMTYAKLSSHDFTYYEDPETIISGKIKAPQFSMENRKVIYRHIFAVALSEFLAKNPEVYDGDNANVFLNEGGYERLVEFLHSPNERLTRLLKASVPSNMHSAMGVTDGSWVDELIGDTTGILSSAVETYREEIRTLEKELRQAQKTNPTDYNRIDLELRRARCGKDDKFKRSLIDFWTRNNVLPKYGFPVDTVELRIAGKKGSTSDDDLTLARDLQMAIGEYAPGSGIIADGKLYTSRYVRLESERRQAAAYGFFARCRSCDQFNFTNHIDHRQTKDCISCGKKIPRASWHPTLEPRLGFITDKADAKEAPLHRPKRDYKTDDYYVGDTDHDVIKKTRYSFAGTEVELQSTANDSLVVVGSDSHRVCPCCGWTSNAKETGIKEHLTSWGSKCFYEGAGKEYNLSHVFKTDVVKITFFSADAADRNKMLSVMYALLEGLSRELGIERTDLKGCLHRQSWSESGMLLHSIILYDAVAGGAGHVRRLVTDTGDVFAAVIRAAYNVVHNCTCEPSCYQCLRNYYNQQIHDFLDRKSAEAFLSNFLADYSVVDILTPEATEYIFDESGEENLTLLGDDYVSAYDSWNEVFDTYQFEGLNPERWDVLSIDKECLILPNACIGDIKLEPYLAWPSANVMLFDVIPEEFVPLIDQAGWIAFDSTSDIQNIQTALNERGSLIRQ